MVKVHKKFKKLLAGVMAVMLLLSMTAIPASAGGILGDLEMETSAMNELSARAAINSYFSQRLSFLKGEIDSIDVINEGMMADEIAHKAHLEEENIVMQSSNVAITSVSCWDNMAVATATETAVFVVNGEIVSETIVHEMTFYCNEQNIILLQSDAYIEGSSEFASCSYLSPEELAQAELQAVTAGSGSCMSYVAYMERGTQENSDGSTKYAQWLINQGATDVQPNDPWCAMFVLWCAGHANISYDIIPYRYGPNNMRDRLDQMGKYQSSYSNAVQPGDLVFINGTSADPSHVGIIYSISSSSVTIVDGNWLNQVAFRTLPIGHASIVGYGTPGYLSPDHVAGEPEFGATRCVVCGCWLSTPNG